jgi:hypothetical protein
MKSIILAVFASMGLQSLVHATARPGVESNTMTSTLREDLSYDPKSGVIELLREPVRFEPQNYGQARRLPPPAAQNGFQGRFTQQPQVHGYPGGPGMAWQPGLRGVPPLMGRGEIRGNAGAVFDGRRENLHGFAHWRDIHPYWWSPVVIFPAWVWYEVHVNQFQCTAFNENMTPFVAYADTEDEAADRAIAWCATSANGDVVAAGCYIPASYCRYRGQY